MGPVEKQLLARVKNKGRQPCLWDET
jgi:hypothetical protein